MVARQTLTVGTTSASRGRRDWWTVAELAEHYCLAERTVYAAIKRGDLVAHRFGGKGRGVRIADADRRAWEGGSRDEAKPEAVTAPSRRPRPLVTKHFPKE